MKKIILFVITLFVSTQLMFGNLTLDKKLDEESFDKQAKKNSIAAYKVGVKNFIFERPYKETGRKALEVRYNNGKREGLAKFYYSNGKLLAQGNYMNDKKNGIWEYYDEEGNLTEKVNFINGIRK